MKVVTYCRVSADIPQRQMLAQWYRSWRDAGFDPCIVTPEMQRVPDLTKVLKASGQEESMFARWFIPTTVAFAGPEPVLMVEPTILPAIQAGDFHPGKHSPKFVRYDLKGRVIYARMSPARTMADLLRRDFSEFEGKPFTDWDLLLLTLRVAVLPDAPTLDRTSVAGMDEPGDWFFNNTQEQILELRAKRLAT